MFTFDAFSVCPRSLSQSVTGVILLTFWHITQEYSFSKKTLITEYMYWICFNIFCYHNFYVKCRLGKLQNYFFFVKLHFFLLLFRVFCLYICCLFVFLFVRLFPKLASTSHRQFVLVLC